MRRRRIKLVLFAALCGSQALFSQENNISEVSGVSESIEKDWELLPEYRRGNFRISEYKPIYIVPLKWSANPNKQPIGLNPNRPVPEYKDYQNIEASFQVSLKAKVVQGLIKGKGDLWVGFTQVAHWQLYNGKLSRPFRETNYEPELIATYPLRFSAGDFKMKMISLSVNHQSNGKEELNSRSWNRFILGGYFDYKNWTLITHFWHRISENEQEDDNPKITDYIGRGDARLVYQSHNNVLSLYHRNNLSFRRNRSFTELTYVRSIFGMMRGMFQISHGYGESLVDYNHKTTIASFGILFKDF